MMRADLYTAPILFLLGAAMAYGGWTMDRLEIRQIHPASIPGLVPMMLGAALVVASIVLFLQARATLAAIRRDEIQPEEAMPGSRRDLLSAALLCGVYAIALVGTIPFPVATALFVAAFVIVFEADRSKGRAHLLKVTAIGAVLGIAVATTISILFRYAFLVRLP